MALSSVSRVRSAIEKADSLKKREVSLTITVYGWSNEDSMEQIVRAVRDKIPTFKQSELTLTIRRAG